MPGGTDVVDKVQGNVAVDVDATTADVYQLLSKWRKEVGTWGPRMPVTSKCAAHDPFKCIQSVWILECLVLVQI
jgi:hypothetical protein